MVSNCLLKSVNLIFSASPNIPQLMLLLLREAPRAQKVLLPGLVSIVIENQKNYFETTWNSSMPVDTTFSWSTEERPRSAASLSSLKRARGYSLEYARAHFFQFLLTFDACSLTSTTVSRHLWAKKFFVAELEGPQTLYDVSNEKALWPRDHVKLSNMSWICHTSFSFRYIQLCDYDIIALSPAHLTVGRNPINNGSIFKFWNLRGGGWPSSPDRWLRWERMK